MKFKDVSNPVYIKEDGSVISCNVTIDGVGIISFQATSFDPEEYGVQLWKDLVSGKYGDIEPYVPDDSSEKDVIENTVKCEAFSSSALKSIGIIQCSAAAGNPRDGDTDNLLALQKYVDRLRDWDCATAPEAPPLVL